MASISRDRTSSKTWAERSGGKPVSSQPSGSVSPDSAEDGDDDDWKQIQKRVFTRWCNERLKVINVEVTQLPDDFCNGVKLIDLVQVLSRKMVGRYTKKPRIHAQKMENVDLALNLLTKKENIKLVNIGSGDIVGGNLKLTLGLVWTLILHYQISIGFGIDQKKSGSVSAKQVLMEFVQDFMPHQKVANFTTDWNDGRLVATLVDGTAPGLCPEAYTMTPDTPLENATRAMTLAQDWLGVPMVLLPEDIINPKVDSLSVITYLSQFPEAKLKEDAPIQTGGDPTKVKAYGNGLKSEGISATDTPIEFFVDVSEAKPMGSLRATITGPNKMDIHPEVTFAGDIYTFRYTPGEEGAYTIKINWWGQPITSSPFIVNVSGSKHGSLPRQTFRSASTSPTLRIYGAGIESETLRAQEPAELWVEGAPPNSSLQLKLIGPKGQLGSNYITIQPIAHGCFHILYYPPIEGQYTLVICIGGKEIGQSPYTVNIGPPAANIIGWAGGLGITGLDLEVGKSTYFYVFTPTGLKQDVRVTIDGPKGTVSCNIEKLIECVFKCSYILKLNGLYTITVTIGARGKAITLYYIVNVPSSGLKGVCKIWGSGVSPRGVQIHQKSQVFIKPFTPEDPVTCSIKGIEGQIPLNEEKDKNVYIYTYTPTVVGTYMIDISCQGKPLPKSPFPVNVTDISQVSLTGTALDNKPVPIKKTVTYNIDAKRAGKGQLECFVFAVEGSKSASILPKINEKSSGEYEVSLTPAVVTQKELVFTYDDLPITQKPIRLNVIDASKVKVSGRGIEDKKNTSQIPTFFMVDTKDAGDANLDVEILGPATTSVTITPSDKEDKVYKCQYTPPLPGDYAASVIYGGIPARRSPYKYKILPNSKTTASTTSSIAVHGPAIEEPLKVGGKSHFIVDLGDKDENNLEVAVISPLGKVPVTMEPVEEAAAVMCSFPVYQEGPYNIYAAIDGDSSAFKNLPLKKESTFPDDRPKVTVSGNGIEEAIVDDWPEFIVDFSNEGAGPLDVSINGPQPTETVIEAGKPGTAVVKYQPKVAGDYEINVNFKKQPIPGSPFPVKALSKVGLGSSFNYSIDTSKITSPVALTGKVVGPFKRTSVPVALKSKRITAKTFDKLANKHNVIEPKVSEKKKVYTIEFSPTEVGVYMAYVFLNDKLIDKMPYVIYVCDPRKVKISGAGLGERENETCQVRKPLTWEADCSQAGPGILQGSVKGPDNSTKDITVVPSKKKQECYDISYTPDQPGNYQMNFTYSGFDLSTKPAVTVKDSSQGTSAIGAYGPAIEEPLKVGDRTHFIVDLGDKDESSLEVAVSNPLGKVPVTMEPVEEAAAVMCSFPVYQEGPYTIDAAIDGDSSAFKGLPLEKESTFPDDRPKVTVSGNGIEEAIVDDWPEFIVDFSNEGAGPLDVSINGPQPTETVIEAGKPGTAVVKYQPKVAGDYEINVNFKKQPIIGSPFPVKALSKVGLGSSFNYSIDTSKITSPVALTGKVVGPFKRTSVPVALKSKRITAKTFGKLAKKHNVIEPKVSEKKKVYTIEFSPTEVGVYMAYVFLNDKLIDKMPYVIYVCDPRKVKISGAGLGERENETCQVRKPLTWEADCSQAGPGILQGSVKGPDNSTKDITVVPSKKKQECYDISYTPDQPGNYQMNFTYSGFDLSTKPAVTVKDSSQGTSAIGAYGPAIEEPLKVGDRTHFIVDLGDKDESSLEVAVSNPLGKVPVTMEPVEEAAAVMCSFPVYQEGPYTIDAAIDGDSSAFKGLPLEKESTFPDDRPKVTVSGNGIEEAIVDDWPEFIVDFSNEGAGPLDVSINGPQPTETVIEAGKPGTAVVKYQPKVAGDYEINVNFKKQPIIGSPFPVKALSKVGLGSSFNYSIDTSKITSPVALTGKVVGPFKRTSVPVALKSKRITAKTFGKLAKKHNVIEPKVSEKKKVYTIEFSPTEVGVYMAYVFLNDKLIDKMPYVIYVCDPRKVKISGAGLGERENETCQVRKPLTWEADCSQAGPGILQGSVKGPDNSTKDITVVPSKKKQECYDISYTPDQPGNYQMNFTYSGFDLSTKPAVTVKDSSQGTSAIGAYGPAIEEPLKVGDRTHFIVDLGDKDESSLEVAVSNPLGKVPVTMEPVEEAAAVMCSFPVYQEGPYTIDAAIDGDSSAFKGLPLEKESTFPDDRPKVTVSGNGIEEAIVDDWPEFIVDFSNEGAGPLDVSINGPQPTETVIEAGKPGTAVVKYQPKVAGDYEINVNFKKQPIIGSPFPVKALSKVGLGSSFNYSIDTSKITSPVALTGKVVGPFKRTSVPVALKSKRITAKTFGKLAKKHNVIEPKVSEKKKVYTIEFSPTEVGVYMAYVFLNDKLIDKMPYVIYVCDPRKVKISGAGLGERENETCQVRKPLTWEADCSQAGPGILQGSVKGPDNSTKDITVVPSKKKQECYDISYTPDQPGNYQMNFTYSGFDLSTKPAVTVKDSSQGTSAIGAYGPAIEEPLKVGDRTHFIVDLGDKDESSLEVAVSNPLGKVPVTMEPVEEAAAVMCSFPVYQEGPYTIDAAIDGDSSAFKGLPLEKESTFPDDRPKVTVSGNGIEEAIVDDWPEFIVDFSNEGAGPLDVSINGPQPTETVIEAGKPGTAVVKYQPKVAGDYEINVNFKKQPIIGSPFPVKALSKVGLGSSFNYSIDTSKITSPVALTGKVVGPFKRTSVPVALKSKRITAKTFGKLAKKHNVIEPKVSEKKKVYTIEFSPTEVGVYMAYVFLNDKLIDKMPYVIYVCDPRKVKISGAGLGERENETCQVRKPLTWEADCSQAGPGILQGSVKGPDNSTKDITVVPSKKKQECYDISYTPDQPGNYQMNFTYSGFDLSTKPAVTVKDSSQGTSAIGAYGPAIEEPLKVGDRTHFIVDLGDKDESSLEVAVSNPLGKVPVTMEPVEEAAAVMCSFPVYQEGPYTIDAAIDGDSSAFKGLPLEKESTFPDDRPKVTVSGNGIEEAIVDDWPEFIVDFSNEGAGPLDVSINGPQPTETVIEAGKPGTAVVKYQPKVAGDYEINVNFKKQPIIGSPFPVKALSKVGLGSSFNYSIDTSKITSPVALTGKVVGPFKRTSVPVALKSKRITAKTFGKLAKKHNVIEPKVSEKKKVYTIEFSPTEVGVYMAYVFLNDKLIDKMPYVIYVCDPRKVKISGAGLGERENETCQVRKPLTWEADCSQAGPGILQGSVKGPDNSTKDITVVPSKKKQECYDISYTPDQPGNYQMNFTYSGFDLSTKPAVTVKDSSQGTSAIGAYGPAIEEPLKVGDRTHFIVDLGDKDESSLEVAVSNPLGKVPVTMEPVEEAAAVMCSFPVYQEGPYTIDAAIDGDSSAFKGLPLEKESTFPDDRPKVTVSGNGIEEAIVDDWPEFIVDFSNEGAGPLDVSINGPQPTETVIEAGKPGTAVVKYQPKVAGDYEINVNFKKQPIIGSPFPVKALSKVGLGSSFNYSIDTSKITSPVALTGKVVGPFKRTSVPVALKSKRITAKTFGKLAKKHNVIEPKVSEKKKVYTIEFSPTEVGVYMAYVFLNDKLIDKMPYVIYVCDPRKVKISGAGLGERENETCQVRKPLTWEADCSQAGPGILQGSVKGPDNSTKDITVVPSKKKQECYDISYTPDQPGNYQMNFTYSGFDLSTKPAVTVKDSSQGTSAIGAYGPAIEEPLKVGDRTHFIVDLGDKDESSLEVAVSNPLGKVPVTMEPVEEAAAVMCSFPVYQEGPYTIDAAIDGDSSAFKGLPLEKESTFPDDRPKVTVSGNGIEEAIVDDWPEFIVDFSNEGAGPLDVSINGPQPTETVIEAGKPGTAVVKYQPKVAGDYEINVNFKKQPIIGSPFPVKALSKVGLGSSFNYSIDTSKITSPVALTGKVVGPFKRTSVPVALKSKRITAKTFGKLAKKHNVIEPKVSEKKKVYTIEFSPTEVGVYMAYVFLNDKLIDKMPYVIYVCDPRKVKISGAGLGERENETCQVRKPLTWEADCSQAGPGILQGSVKGPDNSTKDITVVPSKKKQECYDISYTPDQPGNYQMNFTYSGFDLSTKPAVTVKDSSQGTSAIGAYGPAIEEPLKVGDRTHFIVDLGDKDESSLEVAVSNPLGKVPVTMEPVEEAAAVMCSFPVYQEGPYTIDAAIDGDSSAFKGLPLEKESTFPDDRPKVTVSGNGIEEAIVDDWPEFIVDFSNEGAGPLDVSINGPQPTETVIEAGKPGTAVVKYQPKVAGDYEINVNFKKQPIIGSPFPVKALSKVGLGSSFNYSIDTSKITSPVALTGKVVGPFKRTSVPVALKSKRITAKTFGKLAKKHNVIEPKVSEKKKVYTIEFSPTEVGVYMAYVFLNDKLIDKMPYVIYVCDPRKVKISGAGLGERENETCQVRKPLTWEADCSQAGPGILQGSVKGPDNSTKDITVVPSKKKQECYDISYTPDQPGNYQMNFTYSGFDLSTKPAVTVKDSSQGTSAIGAYGPAIEEPLKVGDRTHFIVDLGDKDESSLEVAVSNPLGKVPVTMEPVEEAAAVMCSFPVYQEGPYTIDAAIDGDSSAFKGLPLEKESTFPDDRPKVTVSGNGIEEAIVDDWPEFIVDFSNEGAGPLDVSINGPQPTETVIEAGKPGTAVVKYQPKVAGDYEINVNFKKQPIIGSPFPVKALSKVGLGSSFNYSIDTSKITSPVALTGKVVGPFKRTSVPVALKSKRITAKTFGKLAKKHNVIEPKVSEKKKVYTIEFSPTEVGVYMAYVFLNDKLIDKMPYVIYVCDPRKVKISGAGLGERENETCQVRKPLTWEADCSQAGPGILQGSVKGPDNSTKDITVVPSKKKQECYDISYTPDQPGNYQMNFTYSGFDLSTKPAVTVKDSSQGTSAIGAYGPAIEEPLKVGDRTHFIVDLGDKDESSLEVAVSNPLGKVPVTMEPVEEAAAVMCSFPVYQEGPYTIDAAIDGDSSAFKGLPLEKESTFPDDRPKVTVSGNGIEEAIVDDWPEFIVDFSNEGAGPLDVSINGPQPTETVIEAGKPGTAVVKYQPKVAGDYEINVNFKKQPIIGSPFPVKALSKVGLGSSFNYSIDTSKITSPVALTGKVVGPFKRTSVPVALKSKRITAKTFGKLAKKHNVIEPKVSEKKKVYTIEFSPTEVGVYMAYVFLNDKLIDKMPYVIYVCDPRKVKISGAGLGERENETCQVRKPLTWEADCSQAGPGILQGSVKGPDNSTKDITVVPSKKKQECYDISYTPDQPGNYQMNFTYSGFDLSTKPAVTVKDSSQGTSAIGAYGPAIEEPLKVGDRTHFIVDLGDKDESSLEVAVSNPLGKVPVTMEPVEEAAAVMCSFPVYQEGPYTIDAAIDGDSSAFKGLPLEKESTFPDDRPKVTVSGNGIEEAIVDDWPEFIVDFSNEGAGPLDVSINGPQPTETVIEAGKPGTAVVKYQPKVAGDYEINVNFKKQPIIGSPFPVKALSKVGLGSSFNYSIDTSKITSPVALTGKVVGPFKRTSVPVALKSKRITAKTFGKLAKKHNVIEPKVSEKKKVYTIEFSPTEVGVYMAYVFLNDKLIDKMPYVIYVCDPRKVKISGAGLGERENETCQVRKPLTWEADCSQAGPGILQGSVKGPDNSTKDITVVPSKKKQECYDISYTPDQPGNYQMNFTYSGFDLSTKPTVTVKDFSPEVDEVSPLGEVPIKIKPVEEEVAVMHSLPIYQGSPYTIDDTIDATMNKDDSLKDSSAVETEVSPLGEVPIKGKPIEEEAAVMNILPVYQESPYTIDPAIDEDSSASETTFSDNRPKVTVSGNGIKEAIVDNWPEFIVDFSNEGAGSLDVSINGPKSTETVIEAGKPGTAVVKYQPKVAGDYEINVNFNKQPIPGSPFVVKAVYEDTGDKKHTELIKLEATGVKLGTDFSYTVDTSKITTPVTLTGKVLGPFKKDSVPEELKSKSITAQTFGELAESHNVIEPKVSEKKKVYTIEFSPTEVGVYMAYIFFGDKLIDKMPYEIYVCDPRKVKLSGAGLGARENESCHIENPLTWEADCSQAGPGTLKGYVGGPDNCTKDFTIAPSETKPEFYNISYTPDRPGSYQMLFAYSGFDVGTKPTVMVSDPSKAQMEDKGMKVCLVGEKASFPVDLSSAGAGRLQANLEGPTEVPIEYAKTSDSTCVFGFTPTEVGKYTLNISFGNKPLSDKPMEVMAIDPTQVIVSGSGVTGIGAQLNHPAQVYVDCTKSGIAPLDVSLKTPDEKVLPLETSPNNEEGTIFESVYTPNVTGPHELNVNFAGKPIEGSPFKASIADPSQIKVTSQDDVLYAVPGESCRLDFLTNESTGPGVLTGILEPINNENMTPVDAIVNQLPDDPNHYEVLFPVPGPGQYKGTVYYNGVPVCDSFYIMGGKPIECKVEGPGVKPKIAAGRDTQFTVEPKGEEPVEGTFEAIVHAPDESLLPVTVSQEGLVHTVQYKPILTGDYTIDMSFDSVPISDSPCKSKCIDVTHLALDASPITKAKLGEPLQLKADLSTVKDDEGDYTLSIEGPEDCPITSQDEPNGIQTFTIAPTKPGLYSIMGMYDELPVAEEPLKLFVTDKELLKVSGPGVTGHGVKPGKEAIIKADLSQSGPGSVTGNVTTPAGDNIPLTFETPKNTTDDILTAAYTPMAPGDYQLDIKFDDEPISASPYTVPILDPSQISLGGDAVNEASIGCENILDLTLPKVVEEEVTMTWMTSDHSEAPFEYTVEKIDDDHCKIKYKPQEEGLFEANILYDGNPLFDEPWNVTVGDCTKAIVSGPAVEQDKLQAGVETSFTVDTTAAGKGKPIVDLKDSNNEPVDTKITETAPGVSEVTFTPQTGGNHELSVKCCGQPTTNSPYHLQVFNPSAVKCTSPDTKAKLGEPVTLQYDISEAGPGQFKLDLEGPEDCQVIPDQTDQGILSFTFIPNTPGVYKALATFESVPCQEEPQKIKVLRLPTVEEISLVGDAVNEASIGCENILDLTLPKVVEEEVTMTWMTSDHSEAPFEYTVEKIDDDHCKIKYKPQEEGIFEANILYDGNPLFDEPWNVTVGDCTKAIVSGPAVEQDKLQAGVETSFTVDTTAAGKGKPIVDLKDSNNEPVDTKITETASGVSEVTFTPQTGGNHELSVKCCGQPTTNSPYHLQVFNPSAVKCTSPDTKAKLGEPVMLQYDISEAGPGQFKLDLEGPEDCQVIPDQTDQGMLSFTFTPNTPGVYKALATFESVPCQEEPQKIKVLRLPTVEEITLGGDAVNNASIGCENILDLTLPKVDEEEVTMTWMTSDHAEAPFEYTVEKIDEDHCKIKYKPQEEGIFEANILYDGNPLFDEPWNVTVGDCTKAIVSGPAVEQDKLQAGVETSFTVDTTAAGKGKPIVDLKDSNNEPVDTKITETAPGVSEVTFTPQTGGNHELSVKCCGQPTTNSPYHLQVFNPSAVKCTSPDTKAKLGEPVTLQYDISEAGPGQFKLDLEGPEDCQVIPDQTDQGMLSFTFTPNTPGVYKALATFESVPCQEEPLEITVVDLAELNISGPGATGKKACIGEPVEIIVDTSKSGPANVQATLTTPTGEMQHLMFKPKEDSPHLLVAYYTPSDSGYHSLLFTVDDEPVYKEPLRAYIVDPQQFHLVQEEEKPLIAVLGRTNFLELFNDDGFDEPDNFGFLLEDEKGDEFVIDCKTHTLDNKHIKLEYLPELETAQYVTVCYNEVPIGEKMSVARLNISECNIEGVQYAVPVNIAASFRVNVSAVNNYENYKLSVNVMQEDGSLIESEIIELREDYEEENDGVGIEGRGALGGIKGEIEVGGMKGGIEIGGEREKQIEGKGEVSRKGIYQVFYTPTQIGPLYITVKFGPVLIQEPFTVHVVDPSLVTCTGLENVDVLAGESVTFAIDTTAAGSGAELKVELEGPEESSVSCENIEGGHYSGVLKSLRAGACYVYIRYAGVLIPNAPYRCGFNRTEADATKCTIQDIQTPGKFMVDCRDGGGNGVLEVAVYGAYVPARYIAVEHNGDYTFSVSYDIPDPVETVISVKWHGEHLQGSPFKVVFKK